MEKVWAKLRREAMLPAEIPRYGHKDVYFSNVREFLINRTDAGGSRFGNHMVLRRLFAVQQCLGITNWNTYTHPFHTINSDTKSKVQVVPRRYNSYFTNASSTTLSDLQMIRLVMEVSCYIPKSLTINILKAGFLNKRFLSEQWLVGELHDSFVTYLEQVHQLNLKYTGFYDISAEEISSSIALMNFFMGILSSRGQSQLEELSIQDVRGLFLESTLSVLTPYLVAPSSKLEKLSVASALGTADLTDTATSGLANIVAKNQTSLHALRLQSVRLTNSTQLCSNLARLFQQPQFHKMSLSQLSMTAGSFQKILCSFLTTTHCEDTSLHLSSVSIHLTPDFASDLPCLDFPVEQSAHKTLVLSSVQLPYEVCLWLQERILLRLNEIKLVSPSEVLLSLVLNHPRVEIEKLSLLHCDCHKLSKYELNFGALLSSTHLKSFEFSHLQYAHDYGTSRLLLNLVEGLHKQAKVGRLETLDVSHNRLDVMPESELSALLEAVFSLPNLEDFTLNISSNSITEEHLKLMHKLWRERADGKPLKKLICCQSKPLTDDSELTLIEDMARDFVLSKQ